MVLDDITDPDTMVDWWPASHTGTGWVLATTRLHDDPVLSGGGRQVVDIDVYEKPEATDYLRQRLAHAGKAHLFDNAAYSHTNCPLICGFDIWSSTSEINKAWRHISRGRDDKISTDCGPVALGAASPPLTSSVRW